MSNSGIYKICIGPKCFYYGSSQNMHIRKQAHLSALKANRHHNARIQRAYNKYQSFIFEVIEECQIEELLNREQFYIDKYFDDKNNLNINRKADSPKGIKVSKTTKNKISKSLSGRKLSEEHKKNLCKPKSSEARKNMALAQQNKPIEIREKISNTLKGHVTSEETRSKISKSLTGRTQSEETIRKKSESLKKAWEKRKQVA